MKKIFIAIITLTSLIIFFLIFNEYLDQPSPQKLTVMSMLSCGEYIKESHATNKDLDGGCRTAISEIRYSKDNQINLYNQEYQLHLTYTPKDTNEKIVWGCMGEPKKYFPPQCRQ